MNVSAVNIAITSRYKSKRPNHIDYAADEQREDARPELTSHIDDLDKYDTIFVGYPKHEP